MTYRLILTAVTGWLGWKGVIWAYNAGRRSAFDELTEIYGLREATLRGEIDRAYGGGERCSE